MNASPATLALAVMLLLPLVALASHTIVYVYSDNPDLALAASIPGHVASRCTVREADTVYMLDVNYGEKGFCPTYPKGLAKTLARILERGGTIVLGYNTIKAIARNEPWLLKRLGLIVLDDSSPTHGITVGEELASRGAPRSLDYPVEVYRRLILTVNPRDSKVLAYFRDGHSAIVEVRVGRGRLILLLFNPVWPHERGAKGYDKLVRAIHNYISTPSGPAPELVAAATAATLGAAAAAAASRGELAGARGERGFWWLLRRVALVVAVLGYKQVRGEDALEHPVRRGIMDELSANVYSTVERLARKLGYSKSTILWHLAILERVGLVESVKIGDTVVYYQRGQRDRAILLFLMENATRRRILETLAREGTMTISQLARRLRKSKSTILHNIRVLERYHVVEKTGIGYRVPQHILHLLARELAAATKSQKTSQQSHAKANTQEQPGPQP